MGPNNTPESKGNGNWFLISSGDVDYVYRGNGTRLAYDSSLGYKGDGGTYDVVGSTQWAYVADSAGSITYYSAGTVVSGLYDAGSPVSDTYYTKS